MRKLTLICAPLLVLLASCGGRREPEPGTPRPKTGASSDSSPIIINDGSIHVRHKKSSRDHFKNLNSTHVDIYQAQYYPKLLGYLCDPNDADPGSSTHCPATNCASGSNKTACVLDLANASDWDLALCQSPLPCASGTDVDIRGNAGKSTMSVNTATATGYFTFNPPSNLTGELVYTSLNGAGSLASATISGFSSSYQFTCKPNKICLVFDYRCKQSDNSCLNQ